MRNFHWCLILTLTLLNEAKCQSVITNKFNISDIKYFSGAHTEVGPDGTPWFYLNQLAPNSVGEQVFTRPKVEAMGLLSHNCSVGFQLYLGDGGSNYGGLGVSNKLSSHLEDLHLGTLAPLQTAC